MKDILDYYYNKFNNNELEIDKYIFSPGTTIGQDLNFLFNKYFKEVSKDKWIINNSFGFALVLSKYRLSYKEYEKYLEYPYPFVVYFYTRPENILIYNSIYSFITLPYNYRK